MYSGALSGGCAGAMTPVLYWQRLREPCRAENSSVGPFKYLREGKGGSVSCTWARFNTVQAALDLVLLHNFPADHQPPG